MKSKNQKENRAPPGSNRQPLDDLHADRLTPSKDVKDYRSQARYQLRQKPCVNNTTRTCVLFLIDVSA